MVSSALDTSWLESGRRAVALRGSKSGLLGLDPDLKPVDLGQLIEYSPSVFLGKEN